MRTWSISPGWIVLLVDAGLSPADVLRQASLPEDLFTRSNEFLNNDEYFRLWKAAEAVSQDPNLPLKIGATASVEAFDPAIFAALCSANFNAAVGRIATYKRLVCPLKLTIDESDKQTVVRCDWGVISTEVPTALLLTELVFFTRLARIGTRASINPIKAVSPQLPQDPDAYQEFFGVRIESGPQLELHFSAEDANQPFLTADESMWNFFEPALKKRLSELQVHSTTTERTQAALLELLPSGKASVQSVAKKLLTSTRSLQRKLKAEGQSFQSLLSQTREHLARHYLTNSTMTPSEISFLLGFGDPNSFFRAFQSWTGQTPEQLRNA